jgi:hypothetical protein
MHTTIYRYTRAKWVPIILSGIPSMRLFIIVLASAIAKSSRPGPKLQPRRSDTFWLCARAGRAGKAKPALRSYSGRVALGA